MSQGHVRSRRDRVRFGARRRGRSSARTSGHSSPATPWTAFTRPRTATTSPPPSGRRSWGTDMLISLIIISCLAIMSDAFVTRHKIQHGSHESNKLRKCMINKLGLSGGTLGVSAAVCALFVVCCLAWGLSSLTILSCIMVTSLFGFVSYSQWTRK